MALEKNSRGYCGDGATLIYFTMSLSIQHWNNCL